MEKKIKLEFIARITSTDGNIIERKVEVDKIPTLDEFDLKTKKGFLESFDAYEKAVIEARNKIGEEITEEYFSEISKKKLMEK
jgi:hypothetical protein